MRFPKYITMWFLWFVGPVIAFCAVASATDYPGYSLFDSKFVPSNGSVVTSSVPLQSGKTYLVEAAGTWLFDVRVPQQSLADARWLSDNDWATWVDTRVNTNLYNPIGLWLGTSNDSVWGDFNPSHVYTTTVLGGGTPVSFHIYDEFPNSNLKAYADNSGGLSVSIFAPVPEPTFYASAALMAYFSLMRRRERVGTKK